MLTKKYDFVSYYGECDTLDKSENTVHFKKNE